MSSGYSFLLFSFFFCLYIIDTSSQIVSHATQDNCHGRKCFVCNKLFSTPGNRRKHEKTIHKSRNLSNSMNVIGKQIIALGEVNKLLY